MTKNYFYHGEKWREFSGGILPAQSLFRREEERLSNKTIEVKTLGVTSQGTITAF